MSPFRSQPPLDLVEQVLKCANLYSIHDSTLFQKTTICLKSLETLLPVLEPYYFPCKATKFLHCELTPNSAITIFRHLLQAHSIALKYQEKTFSNSKSLWYYLYPLPTSLPVSSITVSFD
jgi:hypothetical protein